MKSSTLSTSISNSLKTLFLVIMLNSPLLAACEGVKGQSPAATDTGQSTIPTYTPTETLPLVKVVPEGQLEGFGLPIETVILKLPIKEKYKPTHKSEGKPTNMQFNGLNHKARL